MLVCADVVDLKMSLYIGIFEPFHRKSEPTNISQNIDNENGMTKSPSQDFDGLEL